MGKSTPSPPPQPDPVATAQAQGAANKEAILESARLNQFNIQSPYGSRSFSGTLGEPDRTMTIGLSPEGQQAYEAQQGLTTGLSQFGANTLFPQVEQAFQEPLDFGGAPALPEFGQGFTPEQLMENAGALEQSTYQRGLNRLQPQFDEAADQINTTLFARGIDPMSEAGRRERERLERSQGEQMENLALSSIGAGRAEQSRLLAEQRAQDALGQQLGMGQRQQFISEQMARRSQPINELAALLQGAPAIGTPQFPNPASYQIAPGDVQGQIAQNYQNQLNLYNQNRSQQANSFGNLLGTAGQLGMLLL